MLRENMFSVGAVFMVIAIFFDVATYGMPSEPEMVFCFYAAQVLCVAIVVIECFANCKKEVKHG